MKIRHISLAILAFWLSACSDFLSVLPETERTVANFYKTPADYNTAVIGTYATFKHAGLYGTGGGSLIWLGEVSTDNTEYGYTRTPVSAIGFEIEDLNYSLSNTYFRDAWLGHYQGIARANGILDRIGDAEFDAGLKAQYEGEARFLRAMFYFNLVQLFGDVQLITTEIGDPYATADIQRSPASDVYALIEADLAVAEEKLPATITAANAGRASKWAAKALLGKVLLTQKKYAPAAAKLKEVIDSNAHRLMASYADVFSASTSFANNKEVILAVQNKGGQIGQGGGFYTLWTPFGAASPDFGVSGGPGDGVNKPTADLIAAYEKGDVRKTASIATSYTNTGGVVINEPYPVKFIQTGIIRGESDVDYPVLRYADVLLMYAETLNEQNQPAAALPLINQVRKRAGLPDLTAGTQADLRLALENERRVEFAFESQRWFDLKRTDRFVPVMTAKGHPAKPFQNLYPVPLRELELNKKLTQNPGY
ncbi:RagB/SusD family nutrient uptake outer membrane protein [Dyadobacter sp. CY261]|uniref:RagB/SusD family nutrient uptake outer membrane protein n=1 Tax=Dyadobacter sp. CY261 TaxID=2907203 RepID=UPI001F382B11|nr:RagB/SusD family nutrient uptake outer membrane protein [Dyadobacter sp. CY261]MCF0069694.1 RagB/SusD family nutrient uptake outer membrane protein [Dyadobacter sp. CY261]